MQLSKNRLLRLLALLFAFSLVAAACGGGTTTTSPKPRLRPPRTRPMART